MNGNSPAFLGRPEAVAMLAQDDKFMRLGERFRDSEAGVDWFAGLLILSVIVALGVGVWLLHRWFGTGRERAGHSPRKLFRELCRAHRLSTRQRRALWRLAAGHEPARPALVFLDPRPLDSALKGDVDRSSRDRLIELRRRLFGQLVEYSDKA